jgi:hypothetical protein
MPSRQSAKSKIDGKSSRNYLQNARLGKTNTWVSGTEHKARKKTLHLNDMPGGIFLLTWPFAAKVQSSQWIKPTPTSRFAGRVAVLGHTAGGSARKRETTGIIGCGCRALKRRNSQVQWSPTSHRNKRSEYLKWHAIKLKQWRLTLQTPQ